MSHGAPKHHGHPDAPAVPNQEWTGHVRRLITSDGRIGRLLAFIGMVAPCALWRLMAAWSSESRYGSITLFCVETGFAFLLCAALIRMRVHDMGEGRITRGLALGCIALIAACLTQSRQAGYTPLVVAGVSLGVLAIALLRPGQKMPNEYGEKPRTLRRTRPDRNPGGHGVIAAAIWMAIWLGIGLVAESSAHSYRRDSDRRNAIVDTSDGIRTR